MSTHDVQPRTFHHPALIRAAATAAMVGLAAAVGGVAVVDALNPQWSWVADMASHYVHGRAGWVTTASLATIGVASAVATFLLSYTTRQGRVGRWLLGFWSVAVSVAAAFPADPPRQWDRPPSTAGLIHGVAGLFAFAALPVAAVLLTVALRKDPEWRRHAAVLTVTAGLTVLAAAPFWVTLVDAMDGPSLTFGSYPAVVGLTERIMLWADLGWLAAVCTGLRRVAA